MRTYGGAPTVEQHPFLCAYVCGFAVLENVHSDCPHDPVVEGLNHHAECESHIQPRDPEPLSAFIRDSQHGVVGGLNGLRAWGWLHVKELWVRPTFSDVSHARTCHPGGIFSNFANCGSTGSQSSARTL